jgi:hypothetical protein
VIRFTGWTDLYVVSPTSREVLGGHFVVRHVWD